MKSFRECLKSDHAKLGFDEHIVPLNSFEYKGSVGIPVPVIKTQSTLSDNSFRCVAASSELKL